MALSGTGKQITVKDSVFSDCGQAVECGYGAPDVNMIRCLCTGNLVGARFADNYDWTYHGFLSTRDCLLLFNYRDAWARNWDDWSVRFNQVDVTDNYLSVSDPCFPENTLWEPEIQPVQLESLQPFMVGKVALEVGVGIALTDSVMDFSAAPSEIPIRLSTYTTQTVSVDCTFETPAGIVDVQRVVFQPGQIVRYLPVSALIFSGSAQVQLTLSNPQHAQLTNHRQVIFQKQ